MAFAGAVMLGDLDDFIAPSQSCVNPLFAGTAAAGKGAAAPAGAASGPGVAKIALDSDFLGAVSHEPVRPNLIRKDAENAAKVSLNDCLACSGCVTSAETVLITQQSAAEMRRALADERYKVRVASFTPQALASLAAHFGLASTAAALHAVSPVFRGLGFDAVVDTCVGQEVAAHESCLEFTRRLLAAHPHLRSAAAAVSAPRSDTGGGNGAGCSPLTPLALTASDGDVSMRAPAAVAASAASGGSGDAAAAPRRVGSRLASGGSSGGGGVLMPTAASAAPPPPAPSVAVSATSVRVFPSEPARPATAAASAALAFDGDSGGAPAVSAAATTVVSASNAAAEGVLVDVDARVELDDDVAATGAGAAAVPYPLPLLASSCPGWVCYAEKTCPEALPFVSRVKSSQQVTGALVKHAISVLTGGAGLLPASLSSSSPSAPAATAGAGGVSAGEVYHVAVAQCYDKKLEASRRDFWWETTIVGSAGGSSSGGAAGVAEVDCVLTSGEAADLVTEHLHRMQQEADAAAAEAGAASVAPTVSVADLIDAAPRRGCFCVCGGGTAGGTGVAATKWLPSGCAAVPTPAAGCGAVVAAAAAAQVERMLCGLTCDGASLISPAAGAVSSDGFAETALRFAASSIWGVKVPLPGAQGVSADATATGTPVAAAAAASLVVEAGRNADFRDMKLRLPDGSTPLVATLAYGFRNIQTILTRMKRGKLNSCYIEVMACPSGCANGGGQLKAGAADASSAAASTSSTGAPVNPLLAAAAAGKQRVQDVTALLSTPAVHAPDDRPELVSALAVWLRPADERLDARLTHTRYHHVPKLAASASVMKW